MIGQAENPVNFQLIGDIKEAAFPLGVQRANGTVNGGQLFLGRHAGLRIDVVRINMGKIQKAAHPNHEELIQITGKNLHELQTLQQRYGGVHGFLQYAVIEPQPAEFSVLGVGEFFGHEESLAFYSSMIRIFGMVCKLILVSRQKYGGHIPSGLRIVCRGKDDCT